MSFSYAEILNQFTYRNPASKDVLCDEGVLPEQSLYSPGLTNVEHQKKWHRIHYVFKYKFVAPILMLAGKLLGKYMDCDIPERFDYRNLKVFNESFDKAVVDWYRKSLSADKVLSDEQILKERCCRQLNTIKQIMVTVAKNDSAYLNFFNTLSFELTSQMNKEYDGEEISHLYFTSDNTSDVNYFVMGELIGSGKKKKVLRRV